MRLHRHLAEEEQRRGLAVAIMPARRAAQLNVLEAPQYE
jgi:hypothetical protein